MNWSALIVHVQDVAQRPCSAHVRLRLSKSSPMQPSLSTQARLHSATVLMPSCSSPPNIRRFASASQHSAESARSSSSSLNVNANVCVLRDVWICLFLNSFLSSCILVLRYDTIRDAILTCARKPTEVSFIYRTQPTTKKV